MSKLYRDHTQDYRKAFYCADLDGNGDIDCAELKRYLLRLGKDLDDASIASLLKTIGKGPNDSLNFNQFSSVMDHVHKGDFKNVTKLSKPEETTSKMWKKADPDNEGMISLDALQKLTKKEHGVELSEEQMAAIDLDGDGKITYDEFKPFWLTLL